MTYQDLPAINAGLNTLCTLCLLAGFFFIRRGNKAAHGRCMIAAFTVSVVFLACYVAYHHLLHQATGLRGRPFPGQGWVRPVYFFILWTHVVLAVVVVPLVLITLNRARRGAWEAHKRIARWTLPVWLYVSVTGVIVYLMLYHLHPVR
jgi:uncharacterized membrane protein YozB (DUF420 family)